MAIQYPITLSATEPNNNVGILKIRQSDEETQTLVVNITANGQPKSYEGLQPFFCAKLGQSLGLGIIEQKLDVAEMTNPKAGQLEYTFRAEDWQQIGRQVGYFSFRKMSDEHEYVEQFTTRDFYFNVTKNIFSDGLTEVKKDGSTYVWTIEDLIRLFKEYISSGKSDWEEFVDQNREVLESVDPGGKLIGELIDARRPFGGEVYPTLGERLDSEKAEVTAQLAQTAKINSQVNFVDFVQKNKQPYDYMKLLKRADNAYQIWLSNSDKGIIYDFVKDSNDDFVKLNAGFSGLNKNGFRFVDKDVVSDTDLTGNFMISGVSRYTTTIGNTFTLKATGERLVLTINAETRGGLWSVTVDGGEPKMVSCYSPTTVEKDVVIAEGLINVTHTVVGTFLGDDPNNTPSSSPSRGYIRAIDTPEKGTLTGYVGAVSNTTENTLMATGSNKEFAFTVTKDGFQNWVPEHDAKGSAFQITPPEFYIDDQKIDIVNMTVGSTSAKIIGYEFEIKQHFYGHAVGYGPVMKIWTSHKIGLDGKLTFDGKMEAVENFEAVGYPMMLPAQNEFMNEFVSGIYNSKTNNKSEDYSYFSQEKDMVNSGAIISSSNKNLIVAGTLLNPIKTYRLGEGGKPPLGESLFLWNRSSKPKMYWMSMQANNFVIGDTYRWGFEMAMAEIDNVYDMIKY